MKQKNTRKTKKNGTFEAKSATFYRFYSLTFCTTLNK